MNNKHHYDNLIDSLCERIGSDLSTMRHMRLDLTVNDTPFSLVPSVGLDGDIDALAFFAEVGVLPERGRAEAAIGLLELNLFHFGAETPRYCCNPEKPGTVLMVGRLPVLGTEPDAVLQALRVFSDAAKETFRTILAQSPTSGPRPPMSTAALLRS